MAACDTAASGRASCTTQALTWRVQLQAITAWAMWCCVSHAVHGVQGNTTTDNSVVCWGLQHCLIRLLHKTACNRSAE